MIYVDASQLSQWLAKGRHLTGIQRLTLNCVVGLHRVVGSDNLRVLMFDAATGGFKAMRAEYLLGTDKNSSLDRDLKMENPVFGPDDQILLTEWIFSERISAALFNLTQVVEAKVFQFVHDCIPLARPDLFRKYLVKEFQRKMGRAIAQADVVLTNSNHSKQDILKFFHDELGENKAVRVVKLPHEFVLSDAPSAIVDPSEVRRISKIPRALAQRPFVMMVGTLEERKNTQLVMRLWRALRNKHGEETPVLVLVGSYGWHKIGLMVLVFMGRFFSKSIYHVQNCDDETLSALYRRCLFTIYLSSYEGWGLPVGESMWMGKPVLSSNRTSLPEAGQDLVDYVDPSESAAVFATIEKLCFDADYRNARAAALSREKLRSVVGFAKELYQALRT